MISRSIQGFYPYFLILDAPTGSAIPFKGRFTLRVVGGGTTVRSMKKFTNSEIFHYNNKNRFDCLHVYRSSLLTTCTKLIIDSIKIAWATSDCSENRAHIIASIDSVGFHRGYPIYQQHHNGISCVAVNAFHPQHFQISLNRCRWACQLFSPCSFVWPDFPNTPEYFFIMEFSNK